MKFKKNILMDPAMLVVGMSVLLFIAGIDACRHSTPCHYTSDYYGWRELARNIFSRADFTVDWELGDPVVYPPVFPVLCALLTFFTKNFMTSIRYINIFSVSLLLIPLYALVRKILNVPCALLAVAFTVYYYGIGPVSLLYADYFFSLLTVTICWLLLSVLAGESRKNEGFVLAGILLSVACLTKFSAVSLCLASAVSVLCYFSTRLRSLRTGLRMCGFMLLGAAPLLIAYQLLLNGPAKRETVSLSAYTFFDGNYKFRGSQEIGMRKLDSPGTEFSHLSLLKSSSPLRFCLQNPSFILRKYLWGLKENAKTLALFLTPLQSGVSENASVILQGVFLLLLILTGIYFKWRFEMVHILVFASGMLFTPFFHVDRRYLMPYVPLYFVLCLFILNAAYGLAGRVIKNKTRLKWLAGAFFLLLAFSYWGKVLFVVRLQQWIVAEFGAQDPKWERVARWIENDAKTLPGRARIMAASNYPAYWADTSFVYLPYDFSWSRLIRFATLKKADYLVVDCGRDRDAEYSRSDFKGPLTPEALIKAMRAGAGIAAPVTETPLDSLNRLLGDPELYKKMKVLPEDIREPIQRLRQGDKLSPVELQRMNKTLVEANFPGDSPKSLWRNILGHKAHEVVTGNNRILIVKI